MRRTILRGKETGQWLSVMPSMLNGMESPHKSSTTRCTWATHGLTPGDLPTHCDRYSAKFSICHALECKVGYLIILQHNEVNDELGDLATKAMTPSAMRAKPLILKGSTPDDIMAPADKPPVQRISHPDSRSNGDGKRGDLLLHGLYAHGTDTIVDVRITHTDAKSYHSKDPHKVLAKHEHKKKRKYLDICLAQLRHFTLFVMSTYGMVGCKAKELLKRLSLHLSNKWQQPYLVVQGCVNARSA
jgi:hypothetical protein